MIAHPRPKVVMRYSLWSHGRLVGHTTLDLLCHQNRFIQGFLEPTAEAGQLLADATGVVAVCAKRHARAAEWPNDDEYFDAFTRACERREALDFVLRDEAGEAFDHDFIRIYDLFDQSWQSGREVDEPDDAEIDADLLSEMEEDLAVIEESDRYGSAWAPPEDERWSTMQYYIQVFLERTDDDTDDPPWL